MISEEVSGFVLAGGQSSRMGQNKALLQYNGKPLVMHAAGILKQVCHNVVISAGHHNYTFPVFEVWQDEIQLDAPIAGILSCLKRSPDSVNVFLSCDMPLIDPDLILQMLAYAREYEVVVPEHEGFIEPLCAIFNKSLLPVIEAQINKKDYSLKHLLKLSNHKIIDAGTLGFMSNMFLNVNTYGDFNLLNRQ